MNAEDPRLKGIIEDILNKYLNFVDENKLKAIIFKLVEDNYMRALSNAEIKLDMNFIPSYKSISFLQTFGFDNVKRLTSDMKDNLRREVSLALMNRENVASINKRVRDVLDSTIERAKTITITESHRAFNMGNYQAATESGRDYVKQWSAAEGERTCEICGNLDGQIVGMNDNFSASNGEEYFLAPAHPNCRCRILYVAKSPGMKAGSMQTFQGHNGVWRTVRGVHIFFTTDGHALMGNGKEATFLKENMEKFGVKNPFNDKKEESKKESEKTDVIISKDDDLAVERMKKSDFDIDKHVKMGGRAKSGELTDLGKKVGIPENKMYNELGPTIYHAYKDKILKYAKDFKDKWSMDDSAVDRDYQHGISYMLSFIGRTGLRSSRGEDNAKELNSFIDDLRKATNNDVAQINKVLKYMGENTRVKKEGLRQDGVSNPRTAEDIKNKISSHVHKNINYDISANYRKSTSFKSDESMHAIIKEALDTIPEGTKDILKKHGTKLTFINRSELKTLNNQREVRNAAGFYNPENKQIYIYPGKGNYGSDYLLPAGYSDSLKSAGYDDAFIESFKKKAGANTFKNTIVHEIGHAIALNDAVIRGRSYDGPVSKGGIQEKYDDFRRKLYEDGQTEFSHISKYSMTNSQEDFAEHFAYYALHKDFVDKEFKKEKSGVYTPSQIKKFKWMKEEVWGE